MSKDSKDEHKTDWSKVEVSLQRREASELPLDPAKPMQAPALTTPTAELAKAEGFITKFKANKIERQAALQFLDEWYKKQLEVGKHSLMEAAKVRKAEISVIASQFLENLNSRHLAFLMDLGLRNEDSRNKAFLALNEQTAGMLRQIQDADWPEFMVEKTISGVTERYGAFFGRIMNDLGQTSKK